MFEVREQIISFDDDVLLVTSRFATRIVLLIGLVTIVRFEVLMLCAKSADEYIRIDKQSINFFIYLNFLKVLFLIIKGQI